MKKIILAFVLGIYFVGNSTFACTIIHQGALDDSDCAMMMAQAFINDAQIPESSIQNKIYKMHVPPESSSPFFSGHERLSTLNGALVIHYQGYSEDDIATEVSNPVTERSVYDFFVRTQNKYHVDIEQVKAQKIIHGAFASNNSSKNSFQAVKQVGNILIALIGNENDLLIKDPLLIKNCILYADITKDDVTNSVRYIKK